MVVKAAEKVAFMSAGNWLAAVIVFSVCVGFFALIFWRKDVTRRNAYLAIISEAAKIRDDARLMMAKAVAIAEDAKKDIDYRVCEECGQIRSRFESESGKCIECAAKQVM